MMAEFRDQVKALVRTTDPEVRRKLPIPYEYILYREYVRRGPLPFAGGLLDQPHILLWCFRIIEDELSQAEALKQKIDEINRQQWENFKQQSQPK
jgi:hypothetical protein